MSFPLIIFRFVVQKKKKEEKRKIYLIRDKSKETNNVRNGSTASTLICEAVIATFTRTSNDVVTIRAARTANVGRNVDWTRDMQRETRNARHTACGIRFDETTIDIAKRQPLRQLTSCTRRIEQNDSRKNCARPTKRKNEHFALHLSTIANVVSNEFI